MSLFSISFIIFHRELPDTSQNIAAWPLRNALLPKLPGCRYYGQEKHNNY
jgi:hypothetical protein